MFQRRSGAWLVGDEVWESLPSPIRTDVLRYTLDELTEAVCFQPADNSTGLRGRLSADGGCPTRVFNDLQLTASFLPTDEFALLVVGSTLGMQPSVFGGAGVLCADGNPGRGLLRRTSLHGTASFPFDVYAVPQSSGPVVASRGSTWVAQVLYRDTPHPTGTGATNALLVTVR